jgi:hypothetical protein
LNLESETVRNLPTFRDAYRRRRCIVPVDGFFEWKAIKGQKGKQPYTIAARISGMRSWISATNSLASVVITANVRIHSPEAGSFQFSHSPPRPKGLPSFMPRDYARWLSNEPDPGDLMRPFPAEPLRMWPISTRVNKPENDDPSIVEPIELTSSAAYAERSYCLGNRSCSR